MKKALILESILIVLLGISSITYAFLSKTNTNTNTLVLGTVTPVIMETFDSTNKIKEDVYIKNNGNIDIYVRVALVFSFEDSNGVILSEEPIEDDDYTITFSSSTNWVLGSDGYYYYKDKIPANSRTDILIDSCENIKNYTDKSFTLDIVVQGIQASPSSSVTEAWGVSVVNNRISV